MAHSAKEWADVAEAIGRAARVAHPRLFEADAIPPALWTEMADAGLLGLTTPTAFGGAGLTTHQIGGIARAFAYGSGVQGLVTTWQSHNLLSDWVFTRFATPAQQSEWRPEIAAGRVSCAFAVSEPGAGAHPKRLSASATPDGDGFRLNGQKAYVTNGPIAAVFAVVVVADTDASGQKRFASFLVPRDAPGLSVHASEHVDFLKPCGHASLTLENVFVPATARLGGDDDVYRTMVAPLRDHEDAAGAWARLGAYERLAAAFKPIDPVTAGAIAARMRAVERLLIDDPTDAGVLSARIVLEDARRAVETALAAHPDQLGDADAALARDLAKLGGVARYAIDARFRRLGLSLEDCD